MAKCMFCGSPVFQIPICPQHAKYFTAIENAFEDKKSPLYRLRKLFKPDLTDSEETEAISHLISFKLKSNRIIVALDAERNIMGMFSSTYKLEMKLRDWIEEDADRTLRYEEWEDGMTEPLCSGWLYIAPEESMTYLTSFDIDVPDEKEWGKIMFVKSAPKLELK